MAQITFDGRSFLLDGRRTWIVGGSLDFARYPAGEWADRLHAAKLAGLNTVVSRVFWNRCEPRPGALDFGGDNDLRTFVRLAQDAGLFVILRPGPFVGGQWDMGGLPTWLGSVDNVAFRQPNAPFLEATGRYLAAVVKEVRDLQVTSPGRGGPIIAVQNEHEWTCGSETLADGYLREINRLFRESGLNVPTINANNLWQGAEGEIDCWSGDIDMFAMLRELSTARPNQPRIVIDFGQPKPPRIGEPEPERSTVRLAQRRLVETLAAGGQFCFAPFMAAQNPGFWGGTEAIDESNIYGADTDTDAPLDVAGAPGRLFHAYRAVATFARSFGRVLAGLEVHQRRVTLDPSPALRDGSPLTGYALEHLQGQQGSVAYVFAEAGLPENADAGTARIMLPDGQSLPVPLGKQSAAWVLFGAHLGGRTELDYSTLCAIGVAGQCFVCYGPAGAVGAVSINGTPIDVVVPKGRAPEVVQHESCTIVCLNEQSMPETFLGDNAVFVGVAGIDRDGEPVPLGPGKSYCIVHGSGEHAGEIESVSVRKSELDDTPSAVTTGPWAHGPADDYLDGSSPRYASIDRPLPLTELGSPYGYGWYRLEFKSGASRKVKIAAPGSGDRLLLALDGEPVGTLGVGPDAQRTMTLSLKRGPRVLTVLADNMGRRADGLGHVAKGLVSPLLEVTPFKLAKPKLAEADPVEPLSMLSPIMNVRDADTTRPERAVWSFTHRKKSQLILEMGPAPSRGLVLLNGTALTFLEPGGVLRRVLSEEPMVKGANTLEFAPLDEGLHDDEAVAALKQAMSAMPVEILEATGELGGTGTWAFAKWEPPLDAMFDELPKTKMAQTSTPSWWRAAFDAADTTASLFIDLKGMTKGQVYLNGHHIARYFVAGADGKSLPPMSRVLLPRTLLRTSGNEVTIFDEHGGNPSKAKLEYAGDQRPLGLTRARG